MPTSSQAMILRGMDIPKPSDVSFRCFRPKWKCFKAKECPRKVYVSNGDIAGESVCDSKANTYHYQRRLQATKVYNKKCNKRFGVDFAKEANRSSMSFDGDLFADARRTNITPTSISEYTFGTWEHSLSTDDLSHYNTDFRNHNSDESLNKYVLKNEQGKAARSINAVPSCLSCKSVGNASQKVASPTQFSYADQVLHSKMAKGSCKVQPPQKKSLLDEVKECVNWKKRVTPTTYVRTSPPRCRPTTVCFSLRNSHQYSHTDVKYLVQKQINCKVIGLQFDPVSVRMCEPGSLDRWLVTFSTRAECDRAVQTGLELGQDKVVVQAWDDLVRDEWALRDGGMAAFGDPGTHNKRRNLEANRHSLALKKFLSVH